MTDTETITVEAEVIEAEPTEIEVVYTPAVITDNLAKLDAYVDRQLEIYIGAEIDPQDYEQVKGARNAMAALNDLKKPIENERKRIKREYETPLKAFEANVKGITAKIDDARNAIKEQVDEADRLFKDGRRAFLEEEYMGCAGAIADVIKFDAILDPRWLNRSTPESKAVSQLYEKTEQALQSYQALQKQQLNHPDEVVKKFADTMDLTAALQYEEELNERDREMEEFKAAQAAAEAVKAGRAAQIIEQVDHEATAHAVGNMVFVADAPQQPETAQPDPEPMEAQDAPPQSATATNPEVHRWLVRIDCEFTGTKERAHKVADGLKALGITGSSIKCIGVIANG